jgi:hypothetical protein
MCVRVGEGRVLFIVVRVRVRARLGALGQGGVSLSYHKCHMFKLII